MDAFGHGQQVNKALSGDLSCAAGQFDGPLGNLKVYEDFFDAHGELIDLAGDFGDAVELCADHLGYLGHPFADVATLVGQSALGQWGDQWTGNALYRLDAVDGVDGVGEFGQGDQVGGVAHVVVGFDEKQVRVEQVGG
ncbi:Uncharacterised protein [Mycobacteroides abscessus subsp. bolletii]|nr:Uncharacterised protein [Mycobacteroides abscessus subsp. bolletii]SKK42435.1 Uncharacterised protein [Mycobacteroides abscessus subsp. bolletii]